MRPPKGPHDARFGTGRFSIRPAPSAGRNPQACPETAVLHATRLGVVVVLALCLLGFRVWVLQLVEGEQYLRQATLNYQKEVVLPALRGEIVDRAGLPLATNRSSYDLVVDTGHYSSRVLRESLGRLAPVVGEPRETLVAALERAPRALGEARLIANVSEPLRIKLLELQSELPGLSVVERAQRYYPNGALGGHVVGYIQEVHAGEVGGEYAPGDLIGRSGLEAAGEPHLRGRKGKMTVRVFASGVRDTREEIRPPQEKEVPGLTLQTHLDLELQGFCESILGASAGSIVVLGASGEVLALASNEPTKSGRLDPNNFTDSLRRGVRENRNEAFGAVMGTWEPGSIYKMVVAYGGLLEGKITPQQKVFCSGSIMRGSYKYTCMSKWGHGAMDMETALQKSCNVYFYTVGERLGVDLLEKYSRLFSFGAPTGLELPGELGGIIPSQAMKKARFANSRYHAYGTWLPGETLHSSIGQALTQVTPLQAAVYGHILANRGQGYQPSLLWRVLDRGRVVREFAPRPLPIAEDPTTASAQAQRAFEVIDEGLWRVVNLPNGTAHKARRPGLSVCGKTGSSEHPGSKTRGEPTHAWFVGYGPRENPQYTVLVFLAKAGHGGEFAAPPAMEIFEKLLLDRDAPAAS